MSYTWGLRWRLKDDGNIERNTNTDDDELFSYTRYGADCWYVNMGESDEPVYDCKEIEAKFQEYIKSENIGV